MTASTRADVGYGERLLRFSRVVDGYHIGARAREILLSVSFRTRYYREAEKLEQIGWITTTTEAPGLLLNYELTGRGEQVRSELREL